MLVSLIVITARLLRAKSRDPKLPTEDDLQRARSIVINSPRTSANLALLGDKYFLFNKDKSAFVMFGTGGRSWVSI